jgi:hypothetical protein
MDNMLSTHCDMLAQAENSISANSETIEELDEALSHASKTRSSVCSNTTQLAIVDEFIDEILDKRLELGK